MTKRTLKAYERFDYNGKVVPGSLVLRDRIPKNGRWKEVQTYQCCNFDPCIYFTIEATPGNLDFWFTISVVADGGSAVTGTITWGDGDTDSFSIMPANDGQFNHTFPNPGSFSGTICVSDPYRIASIEAEIND
jgi:hypothetical protein